MGKNYYQECEEIGNELFEKWCDQLGIFKQRERQPLLCRCDWICTTSKGIKVGCELKVRNTLKYPTIFLELGKYDYLMNQWKTKKIIPWFINLCGDEVLIFDLRKVKPIRVTEVNILDRAHLCHTWVKRYELPTKEAYRFINGVRRK